MAYRRSDPSEGRRGPRDRFDSQFDYQNRRDGETDRRDRRDFHRFGSRSLSPDRERNYREKERERERERERDRELEERERERDRDRPRDSENPRASTGPRESRPQHRSFVSPVQNKSSNSADPRLNRGPEPPPRKGTTISATPASSAPPTPHSVNDSSSSMAKMIAALRHYSQRTNEHGALKLQKEVVEARARAREKEHAQAHPKYAEFPSLKDYHRKLEKRDAEDLNALCKDVGVAEKHWLSAADNFATTLVQVFAELQQQEKDGRSTVPSSESLETLNSRMDALDKRHKEELAKQQEILNSRMDALEKQHKEDLAKQQQILNSRMDALDKQHKEDLAKQQKQIEDLRKGFSIETAQRKKLDLENESLKQKAQDLQNQHTSLTTKVDEHGTSIKRLQDEKDKAAALPSATQTTTITSADLTQVKTMVDQCRTELADLEAKVSGHDQKLGEMDVDLITEGCYSLVATLPRLEQNAKRATDDISVLRADYGQLRTDNEKLRSDTDSLQSGFKQLQSASEQLRSDALAARPSVGQLKSDIDQLKITAEQLKSEMTQLRSGTEESQLAVEKLRSAMPEPPAGDSFLSVKTFTTMNAAVFKTFSGWVDDLKKRVDVVEGSIPTLQTVSKQQNDHSSQIKAIEDQVKALEKGHGQKAAGGPENSRVPTPSPDQRGIKYEGVWKEHDARLKALEATSGKGPYRANSAVSEPMDVADALAHRFAQRESMDAAVEALKAQVAMADQSIKAISTSARLTSESQAAQAQRVGQLEKEVYTISKRLGTAEQALRATDDKFEGRLAFMQQNFTTLDSQMNNLTTESLFQAIVQYIDRYQPGDAFIGQKVERMLQQLTAYDQRLAMLERSVTPNEELANKKRKLSPHMGHVSMINGSR